MTLYTGRAGSFDRAPKYDANCSTRSRRNCHPPDQPDWHDQLTQSPKLSHTLEATAPPADHHFDCRGEVDVQGQRKVLSTLSSELDVLWTE